MSEQAEFSLPPSIVSKADVARLITEVERIDNAMTEAAVRTKAGQSSAADSVLSEQLTAFLSQNELSLEESKKRSELIKQLRRFKETLAVIHMTFASEADRKSLVNLVDWVRTSVHPQSVIEAGLQPDLIAGVYVRTPNHVYDFSARSLLKKGRGLLVEELEGLSSGR